ncbi:DUF934 domain-containing protein [Alloalcanivorax marinus]|uniref:DUF934 domain-containing protein n=1 Tax=Alloalcanivorax marinus TaxID=1177169 RepID=UPI0019322325|nr:DUF934 domain-containing protein [Alloalcanivorax marinus]MBL7250093.1 DUF934 domain-containing protein [Alloalcanivorax marinus]
MNNTIGYLEGVATPLQDDPWYLDEAGAGAPHAVLGWPRWQTRVEREGGDPSRLGVLLDPDQDPEVLRAEITRLPLIALRFPSFRDGRAYSQASLLRIRYGFLGDLRAVGDVLRDQLALMRHCGFSSFAVREDKSVTDALKGLADFERVYARSVAQPEPRFRRHSSVRSDHG